MMSPPISPLDQITFDAARLLIDHPPHINQPNKKLVQEICESSGFPIQGESRYARWPAQSLPKVVPIGSQFNVRGGVFSYQPCEDPGTVVWHVNFADPTLFVAYDSSLMAQDELMVAEHPSLGSIREALYALGFDAVTVEADGTPTPVTITGVQRRCSINLEPDESAGRPVGLYGNAFARASKEQVRTATRAVAPPTLSNILAMAAPSCGFGNYTRTDMLDVLTTAYTAFLATRTESSRLAGNPTTTIVHTGFWGCGAFGGDRQLMTILQSLAGALAGVGIEFWTFDDAGSTIANAGRLCYDNVLSRCGTVDGFLDALEKIGFSWGESDGN